MPWHETDGRHYFYRSEWVKGRCVRRYVGGGQLGELAAAEDDLRRIEREARRRGRQAEQELWQDAEAALAALCGLSDLVLKAALTAAGYRRHCRGQWRKRRERRGDDGAG